MSVHGELLLAPDGIVDHPARPHFLHVVNPDVDAQPQETGAKAGAAAGKAMIGFASHFHMRSCKKRAKIADDAHRQYTSYLSEVDERELWGQQYSPVSAGFGNSRRPAYQPPTSRNRTLGHASCTSSSVTSVNPPGTFVSSASSTTRRNLTLSPFQDSPASTPNISQPRSWIHADILIQGLIASPLDMPHRGGGAPRKRED